MTILTQSESKLQRQHGVTDNNNDNTIRCILQDVGYHHIMNSLTTNNENHGITLDYFPASSTSSGFQTYSLFDLEPLPIEDSSSDLARLLLLYSSNNNNNNKSNSNSNINSDDSLSNGETMQSSLEVDDLFHRRLLKIALVTQSHNPNSDIVQPCSSDHTAPSSLLGEPTLASSSSSSRMTRLDVDASIVSQQHHHEQESLLSDTATSKKTRHHPRRLRSGQWDARLRDLLQFQRQHGHMNVPNYYAFNPQLSQWVKRQRYQYKLKESGKRSTLTSDRERVLSQVGFVWDIHASSWQERWQELKQYRKVHGHCNVPYTVQGVSSLCWWCKHQRRQYNRMRKGLSSTMTPERLDALNALDFDWNPRNLNE